MWKAGFFRLRGVLVGTLAFQAYAGPLGIRLSGRPLMTQDADFAQFWGISENIGESIPHPLNILRGLDNTFRLVPNIDDAFVSTRYRNKMDYAVDFLTPNRGSDEYQGKPARMRALAGSGAQPLRHLDFLIHQPERSTPFAAVECLSLCRAPNALPFTSSLWPSSEWTRQSRRKTCCSRRP